MLVFLEVQKFLFFFFELDAVVPTSVDPCFFYSHVCARVCTHTLGGQWSPGKPRGWGHGPGSQEPLRLLLGRFLSSCYLSHKGGGLKPPPCEATTL